MMDTDNSLHVIKETTMKPQFSITCHFQLSMSSELKVRTHVFAASFRVQDKLTSKRRTVPDCVYLEN